MPPTCLVTVTPGDRESEAARAVVVGSEGVQRIGDAGADFDDGPLLVVDAS